MGQKMNSTRICGFKRSLRDKIITAKRSLSSACLGQKFDFFLLLKVLDTMRQVQICLYIFYQKRINWKIGVTYKCPRILMREFSFYWVKIVGFSVWSLFDLCVLDMEEKEMSWLRLGCKRENKSLPPKKLKWKCISYEKNRIGFSQFCPRLRSLNWCDSYERKCWNFPL